MNARAIDRSRLGVGMAVSLAVHLGVGAFMALEPSADAALVDVAPRPPVRLPPLTLGRSHSEHKTLTWIGFEEPSPHEAAFAEFEQAAMDPNPPAPAPTTAAVAVAVEPPVGAPRAMTAEQVQQVIDQAERFAATLGREFNSAASQARSSTRALSELMRAVGTPDMESGSPDTPVETAQPQVSPTTDSGNAEEQESDGTSTTEPTKIQMGKPAVAQGLFIRTVRPSFRYITRATARPSDPVVKVEIRADGTVEHVHIERSSGNEHVDRAITDAVFMWTAEGDRLEMLGEDETTSILIRISL